MSQQTIHVYAGTAGHSGWFSEDCGETWVHPNSHSGMYLEARVWAIASHVATPGYLFAGTDMGVFRWDEAPARWTPLPSPMQDVWAIVQDPENANVLIAGTRPAGFYRSADAGKSWEKLDAPGISQFSEANMGPTRVTQILFDPVVRDTVWATVEIGGIYRSTDRGRTWVLLDKGLVSGDVHGIAVVRNDNGSSTVFATTNRGLHRSTDRGQTWPELTPSAIQHPTSRFFIRRLASGGLLLVKHGPIDTRSSRSKLTAYLSKDDGKNWSGGLLLDEREGVSYPDGDQSTEGLIRVIYDHNRRTDRHILMAAFREEDVAAGKATSGAVKLRQLVSKGSGGQEKPKRPAMPADGKGDSTPPK